ncbi:hypothetical protein CR513_41845, partial [Mucuna pruriens]
MEGNTRHCVRKLQPVPIGTPNIQSLRCWGGQLKGQWRRAFERKYGNLLGMKYSLRPCQHSLNTIVLLSGASFFVTFNSPPH